MGEQSKKWKKKRENWGEFILSLNIFHMWSKGKMFSEV